MPGGGESGDQAVEDSAAKGIAPGMIEDDERVQSRPSIPAPLRGSKAS
jgi:hypothetical protein